MIPYKADFTHKVMKKPQVIMWSFRIIWEMTIWAEKIIMIAQIWLSIVIFTQFDAPLQDLTFDVKFWRHRCIPPLCNAQVVRHVKNDTTEVQKYFFPYYNILGTLLSWPHPIIRTWLTSECLIDLVGKIADLKLFFWMTIVS